MHLGKSWRELHRGEEEIAFPFRSEIKISADFYILRGGVENEDSKELLEEMERSVHEITRIINNVQSVACEEADASFERVVHLSEVIRRLKLRSEGRFPSLDFHVEGDLAGVVLRIAEEKLNTIRSRNPAPKPVGWGGKGPCPFRFLNN